MKLEIDVKISVKADLGCLFHAQDVLGFKLCIRDFSHENAFSCELGRNMKIFCQLVALDD